MRDHIPVIRRRQLDNPSLLHLLPALTLVLFTRRYIGERFAIPGLLLVMAGLLYLFGSLTGRPADINALHAYALAIAGLTLLHRLHLEWVRFRHGEAALWHSADRGVSWLMLLPLPLHDRFIHMVVEPGLAGLAGWLLAEHVSVWLGFFVVVSAIGVFATELSDYRHNVAARADLRDAFAEGRVQQHRARAWRGKRDEQPKPADPVIRRPS